MNNSGKFLPFSVVFERKSMLYIKDGRNVWFMRARAIMKPMHLYHFDTSVYFLFLKHSNFIFFLISIFRHFNFRVIFPLHALFNDIIQELISVLFQASKFALNRLSLAWLQKNVFLENLILHDAQTRMYLFLGSEG